MYGICGEFGIARKVFDEMPERNLVSWSLIISGAIKNSEYEVGMELFVDLMRNGCFAVNEFALGSVMKACVGMGAVEFGLWFELCRSWLLECYGLEAIETVSSMHTKGVVMDEFTFIHALNACSITHNLDFGSQIHGLIVHNGFESTITLMNSMIDMYAKSGAEYHAWKLFQRERTNLPLVR
ncbi:pentatricopeptide repeat-containing protein [Tanacetum coccineum]